jgi:hypothetical protein
MIGTAVLPILKGVGKLEMQHVILCSKEQNPPEIYASLLRKLYANFCLLKEVTVKTKSHFHDGVVDMVIETITEIAGQDRIIL